MEWANFFSEVCNETVQGKNSVLRSKRVNALHTRLYILESVQKIFRNRPDFQSSSLEERQLIAGTPIDNNTSWDLFGSMQGNGRFVSKINNNDSEISLALDLIPLTGVICKPDYQRFLKVYTKAFPKGGAGLATVSRLLAMKRPDVFVCINGTNEDNLRYMLDIKRSKTRHDYDWYWESVIRTIHHANWWKEPQPPIYEELQVAVWRGRAAFLDSVALYKLFSQHVGRFR
jgi:hypothetical protein